MNNKKEIAIIPKGNYLNIMGYRIKLVEDAKVEGSQVDIDYILKEQSGFNKEIGIISEPLLDKKVLAGCFN